MKQKIKLLSIKPLKSSPKKYIAEFEITRENGKTSKRTTKFGAKGMSDYTIHKDTERRNRYIKRHTKDLRTNDPTRAGYLSMYILWNKKTFKASLADYKRRLNAYNKTGKFPKSIPGSSLKNKFGDTIECQKNKFGRIYLYPFLIDKTRFKNLPPEIISLIEKNLQMDDIIQQYKSYKDKKRVFQLITQELGQRQTDNTGEYIFNFDPNEEESVEWLEQATKLLTKTDINNSFWNEVISNFIIKFMEYHNTNLSNNENYNLSRKYMIILLNKLSFNPKVNFENSIPFYRRPDVLEFFNLEYLMNNFGNASFGNLKNASFGNLKNASFGNLKNASFGNLKNASFGNLKNASFGTKKESKKKLLLVKI